MSGKPRILLYDIETAPALAYAWAGKMYEENLIKIVRPWYILMFSAKWLGEGGVKTYCLPDYPLYKRDRHNDRELVKTLWSMFDAADILIGHNADAFDARKARARFIYHNLPPPSPCKQIDSLKMSRKHGFTSNRLKDLAQFLGVGDKLPHEGFHTWEGCMDGDKRSWEILRKYGAHDTVLLERVYLRLRAYSPPNHIPIPNNLQCTACQSSRLISRGSAVTRKRHYRRLQCADCGHWQQGEPIRELDAGLTKKTLKPMPPSVRVARTPKKDRNEANRSAKYRRGR